MVDGASMRKERQYEIQSHSPLRELWQAVHGIWKRRPKVLLP